MTAESISSIESNDNVRKLQIVKATEELPSRAIPPVLEWGPEHNRSDYVKPELDTPEDLTYNI
jgi:hypothetical protein